MNRSFSADVIKALSIFGVVYIHGSFLFSCSSDFQEHVNWLFRFGVPVFIILWAYFLEKSYAKKNDQERKSYLTKRFIHVFIVFFIWSLVYFFNDVVLDKLTISNFVTSYFSGYGWSGQYFFIILFQLILLYPFLRFCYSNKFLRSGLLCIVALIYIFWGYFYSSLPVVLHKLGDRPFIFWIPYVFLGIGLSKQHVRKIPKVFIFLVLLIPLEFHILRAFDFTHSMYITPGVLIGSSLFCAMMLQNSISIKPEFISKIISHIGNNTMIIFVANPLVFIMLRKLISDNANQCFSPVQKILLPFGSSILILAICLLLGLIIKQTKLNGILQ